MVAPNGTPLGKQCRACLRRTSYSSGACCLLWPQEVQLAGNICFVVLRECLWSSVIQFLIAESYERSRELSFLISSQLFVGAGTPEEPPLALVACLVCYREKSVLSPALACLWHPQRTTSVSPQCDKTLHGRILLIPGSKNSAPCRPLMVVFCFTEQKG